jgi:hypothetical protein
VSSPSEKWSVCHFAQANPDGPDQENVPALLRRVADSIEEFGDIEVSDICFHNDYDAGGDSYVHMVVYYWPRTEEDEES